ncbi:Zn-dependent hydrolase [Thermaerobacter sp. PB12/4term]|nr:Zn-dependent hydrolase [Thermaerobacter sp. PB12/4term]
MWRKGDVNTVPGSRPTVRAERLWADIMQLATFTEPDRPYTRRAFTDVYQAGRRWLAARMQEAGLAIRVDAGGNLIGRWEGTEPGRAPLMLGSHTDTVLGGGRFDGVVGVLGALEAVRALREAGVRLRHPVEVVDFLAEEPSDYGPSCIGSLALTGGLTPEMLAEVNPAGETLAAGIRRMGGDPRSLSAPLRQPGEIAAFVEMHIEQGPVLEQRGVPIGIVTAIASMEWHSVTLEGQPGHAGTTPMELRRDALTAAAEVILAVERTGRELATSGHCVATTGRLLIEPNNVNVVPGKVGLTVDVRSHDPRRLAQAWTEIRTAIERVARTRGVQWSSRCLGRAEGAEADPQVMEALEGAAHALGYPTLRLASGAGHDAMHLARIAPMGMLFIPCRGGRSHCPEEWASPEDVARGTEVLVGALQWLDRSLP